jgi:organic hydroperoxide reductase OsmC/OhrA
MDAHVYKVNVAWNHDRKGIMCSPELKGIGSTDSCIEVATPPQFPKGIPGIWSPEHLFTAAVSSCFMTTFLSIAEQFEAGIQILSVQFKRQIRSGRWQASDD